MALPFEQRRRQTTAKLAALMLANAFIFQEQLSGLEEKVHPIRLMLNRRDFLTAVADHWGMIVDEINYVPIFKVARDILRALPGNLDSENAIKGLARCALDIVTKRRPCVTILWGEFTTCSCWKRNILARITHQSRPLPCF